MYRTCHAMMYQGHRLQISSPNSQWFTRYVTAAGAAADSMGNKNCSSAVLPRIKTGFNPI